MQQHCVDNEDFCSSIIHQSVDVGLPISLVPSINLGNTNLMCCGEPRIECYEAENNCHGLSLRITQTVTYKIPIEYHVKANAGDVTSKCKKLSPNETAPPCCY